MGRRLPQFVGAKQNSPIMKDAKHMVICSDGTPEVAYSKLFEDQYERCAIEYGITARARGGSFDELYESYGGEEQSRHTPRLNRAEYHPRMARLGCQVDSKNNTFNMDGSPCRSPYWLAHEEAMTNAHVAAVSLYEAFQILLRTIEPTPRNDSTFGHAIRHFLLLAATEVESAWKGILKANGYGPSRPTTKDYVKLATPMRLREWTVRLGSYASYPKISPFAKWDSGNATRSLPWYDAYNKVKHDREGNLHHATLEHAVSAMAAVAVMGWAQFGEAVIGIESVPYAVRITPTRRPSWTGEEVYFGPRTVTWNPVHYDFSSECS